MSFPAFVNRLLSRLKPDAPVSAAGRELAPEFDPEFYRRRYPDVGELDDAAAEQHYRLAGRAEGRVSSAAATRPGFVAQIDGSGRILEIGPMANPVMRGPNVRYFDVLPTEALRRKATANGMDADGCPEIDFVSPTGDLSVVGERFDVVISCHSIEHQPNLIAHLQGVARLLEPGGSYFVIVPDKRYCFDHFLPESGLAEVLDADERKASLHSARKVVEHAAMTTHNDPARHWRGDHGEPAWHRDPQIVHHALERFRAHPGHYLDCHAWQFTPDAFRGLIQALFELGLTPLRPVRVYDTSKDGLEFYAVLEHDLQTDRSPPVLPDDFDPEAYLQANPDVARAGIDAERHYLSYGHRENRPLRND